MRLVEPQKSGAIFLFVTRCVVCAPFRFCERKSFASQFRSALQSTCCAFVFHVSGGKNWASKKKFYKKLFFWDFARLRKKSSQMFKSTNVGKKRFLCAGGWRLFSWLGIKIRAWEAGRWRRFFWGRAYRCDDSVLRTFGFLADEHGVAVGIESELFFDGVLVCFAGEFCSGEGAYEGE